MTPDNIIQTIADALRPNTRIRALFLSGSHGNGRADAYSDIDFLLVSDDGASDAMASAVKDAIARTGEIVLWWDRTPIPTLINAITADWTRIDVLIRKPDQLAGQTRATLKPVFDRDDLYATLPTKAAPPAPNPDRFRRQVEEFIRILGLLHLVVGREEYINGVLGIFHLRNQLVELMIEETAAPDRGGVLHLNRLITEDQKAVLRALPPPVPQRDAVVDAHLAYAAAYLPRARARAHVLGVDWPERFEAATWDRLKASLDIARPYDPSGA